MRNFSAFRHSEWTLKRKLFGYMLLLAAMPLAALMIGYFLFGRFGSTEKSIYESLDIQMEVFEKDVSSHLDHLAASGIQLSEDVTVLLESYLTASGIDFSDLLDSSEHLSGIQEEMLEPLKHKLLQEECSGIYVMLDTTVNSTLEHADVSRAGLYLQFNGYEVANPTLLLYRGLAESGKEHGAMPHRKWRQEFRIDQFPEYEETCALAGLPLDEAYRYTSLFTLPGTAENAVLLTVPMVSRAGEFYGLCGYEISASYFMTYYAQPTKITHLTCLIAPGDSALVDAGAGLSCGTADGYHRTPKGELRTESAGDNLLLFSGAPDVYVGVQRLISLSPNNEVFSLSVMMPKADYDQAVNKSLLQNVILWSLLLFFVVNCCLYFSRKFLTPILAGLEQIRLSHWKDAQSDIPEINDLFAFLAEKDQEHEDALRTLTQEKSSIQEQYELAQEQYVQVQEQYVQAQERYEKIQNQYEQAQTQVQSAQTEISRLAYSRKSEIDPDAYAQFKAGILSLTPAERRIFEHYLEGRTVKEILEIASIKESTLRYHNQNIYGKLGVNSLKQLLRYAALMKAEEN